MPITNTNPNLATVGAILGEIRLDCCWWEDRHGKAPGKIFLSYPLFYLLQDYNRCLSYNYSDPLTPKLFNIPVSPYKPSEPDALEYHLSDGGKKLNWKEV